MREVNLKYSDSKVIFANGSFDEWCVYIVKNDKRTPPTDVKYFKFFKELNKDNDDLNVYESFVKIYENTNKLIEQSTLDIINDIVDNSNLNDDKKKIYEGYLVVIYLAMIAEENKKNTKLGKRIKRLGMHNLLIDDMSAVEAANISRGKNWRELDKEMTHRGF